MRRIGRKSSVRALAVLVVCAAVLVSCGGPYSARSVNVPDEKLRIADDFYARKKYTQAGMEYKDFLAVFAGDERGDYAQFMLAESYRGAREYALASVEYRILIADYGYSEYIDDAFFLEGLFQGFFGGLFAGIAIYLLHRIALLTLPHLVLIDGLIPALSLIAVGALLGAVGSHKSLRRVLDSLG